MEKADFVKVLELAVAAVELGGPPVEGMKVFDTSKGTKVIKFNKGETIVWFSLVGQDPESDKNTMFARVVREEGWKIYWVVRDVVVYPLDDCPRCFGAGEIPYGDRDEMRKCFTCHGTGNKLKREYTSYVVIIVTGGNVAINMHRGEVKKVIREHYGEDLD